MFPKLIEGLSLVLGMLVLMHALFSEEYRHADAQNRTDTTEKAPLRRVAPRSKRMAFMAFGSTLLIYGLAAVMLRGM